MNIPWCLDQKLPVLACVCVCVLLTWVWSPFNLSSQWHHDISCSNFSFAVFAHFPSALFQLPVPRMHTISHFWRVSANSLSCCWGYIFCQFNECSARTHSKRTSFWISSTNNVSCDMDTNGLQTNNSQHHSIMCTPCTHQRIIFAQPNTHTHTYTHVFNGDWHVLFQRSSWGWQVNGKR